MDVIIRKQLKNMKNYQFSEQIFELESNLQRLSQESPGMGSLRPERAQKVPKVIDFSLECDEEHRNQDRQKKLRVRFRIFEQPGRQ